nr:unnamed protein product [Callosobruchus analis]
MTIPNPIQIPTSISHDRENKFLALTPSKRYSEVKNKNLCTNCLRMDIQIETALVPIAKSAIKNIIPYYIWNTVSVPSQDNPDSQSNTADVSLSTTCTHASIHHSQVILCTALVYVKDKYDNVHTARVLLDSGSTSHFISQELFD